MRKKPWNVSKYAGLLLAPLLIPSLLFADNGAPALLPFQGRLTDLVGNPINIPSTVSFRIYPALGTCYIYEDTQSVTPNVYGLFSVILGAPSNSTGPANNFVQVFNNDGAPLVKSCAGTFSPSANEWRRLEILVDGVALPTMQTIGSAAFALNSQLLDGKSASAFLSVQGATTQSNVNALVNGADASSLHTHDGRYARLDGSTPFTGSVSGSSSLYLNNSSSSVGVGTISTAADLDIEKLSPSIRLGATLGSGGTSHIDFYSGSSTKRASIESPEASNTLKFKTGNVDALQLDSSQNALFAGSVGVAKTLGLGHYSDAQEVALLVTLGSLGAAGSGTLWVNTDSNFVRYWNGTSAISLDLLASAATNANTPSAIVRRDASGNFTAGTITAAFAGNVTGNVVGSVTGASSLNVLKSGDTMTGALILAGSPLGLGSYTNATQTTLTAGLTTSDLGKTWYNSSSNVINYWDGAIVKTLGVTGAGVVSLNGLSVTAQGFANGSSGTTPAFSSAGSTHTLNIPLAATASVTAGLLSNADYTTFNNKQAAGNYVTALTGDVTAAGPGSVASTIAANAVTNAKAAQMAASTIKGNNTGGLANALDLTMAQVHTLLNDITALTGDVTATGAGGSTAATVASVGGSSAASISTATGLANAATNANTASTIVKRDASGNFTAGTITAALTGNVTGAASLNILKSGGTMTGALILSSTPLGLGSYTSGTEATLTAGLTTTDLGKTWYNSTSSVIKYWDGAVVKTLGVTGAGILSLNGLTGGTQTYANGASGTTPAFSSVGSTHTLNIPLAATASVTAGLLSNADYTTFNNKQAALSYTPVNRAGDTMTGTFVLAADPTVNLGASTRQYVTTYAQPVGNYVTALTGDVTAAGPGSVAATVASVGGSSAASINTATGLANAATNANTASTIVKRDASGNFTAGNITAALTGNVTGNVTGSSSLNALKAGDTLTGPFVWNAGAQDMGAATSFKVPVGAGAAPATSGMIAYDSTANQWRVGVNAVSNYMVQAAAALTNGQFIQGGGNGLASASGYTVATSGTAGIAASNAGTATTLARSDHVHKALYTLQWFFPGLAVAGVQTVRGQIPQGVTGCTITNSQITAHTAGSTASTFNIARCTAAGPACTTTANIYTSAYSLAGSAETGAAGAPNTATVNAGDLFLVNLATVGTGIADINVSMTYKCENIN